MEKKVWSPYQDNILRFLKEQRSIPKWTEIAQILSEEYKIKGFTGKQCKERYQEMFSIEDENSSWSLNEEKILFMLHNELGNKWAIISRKMNGRSDNNIKNHFYSRLRKGLKFLNRNAEQKLGKIFRQIKYSVIFKIIEASQDSFKNNQFCQQLTSKQCFEIKNNLIELSYLEDEENHEFKPKLINQIELYQKINQFSRNYKRKPKKLRRIPTKPQQSIQIQKQLFKKGILDIQFNVISNFSSNSKTSENDLKMDKIQHDLHFSSILKQNKNTQLKKAKNKKQTSNTVQIQKMISLSSILQSEANLPGLGMIKKRTSYFDFLEIEMDKENMFDQSDMNNKDLFMRDFLSLKRLSQPDIHFME